MIVNIVKSTFIHKKLFKSEIIETFEIQDYQFNMLVDKYNEYGDAESYYNTLTNIKESYTYSVIPVVKKDFDTVLTLINVNIKEIKSKINYIRKINELTERRNKGFKLQK